MVGFECFGCFVGIGFLDLVMGIDGCVFVVFVVDCGFDF